MKSWLKKSCGAPPRIFRMRTLNFLAAAILPALCIAPVCQASTLIMTTVTGFINFDSETLNYYDPANGFVPPGYRNSPGAQDSPTVKIVGGNEFGFQDDANLDVTSFSSNGFTFTDTTVSGGSNINLFMTDTAFTGVALISSTFSGLTYSISGDVISVEIPAFNGFDGQVFTASFDVSSTSATPEPSSLALLAIGAAGLAGLYKLRNKARPGRSRGRLA
jgi:hypothetical protein